MLSKDQLLATAKSSPVHIVTLPDGEQVGLRIMSGTERETWEQQIFVDGKVSHEHLRAKLLAKTICDDQGARCFTDADIPQISAMPAPIVIQLFNEAQRLNALTRDDVEEMAKN